MKQTEFDYSSRYARTRFLYTAPSAPEIGAPTLVWRVGAWPKAEFHPENSHLTASNGSQARPTTEEYAARRRITIDTARELLQNLYRRSAIQNTQVHPAIEALGFAQSETVASGMTVWWSQDPDKSALRVRVEIEISIDYLTITFFIDLNKPYNIHRYYGLQRSDSHLRNKIVSHIDNIMDICNCIDAKARYDDDKALMEAIDYLYNSVWDEFVSHFDLDIAQIFGGKVRVFESSRGVVAPLEVATQPTSGAGPEVLPSKQISIDGLNLDLGLFVDGFLPFISRLNPFGNPSQSIACTIADAQALYIGNRSHSSDLLTEEGEVDILVPGFTNDFSVIPKLNLDKPQRYFVVAHKFISPANLGLMLDELNTLGTTSLQAQKDFLAIERAGSEIRALGHQLDAAVSNTYDAHAQAAQLRRRGAEAEADATTKSANDHFQSILEKLDAKLPAIGQDISGGFCSGVRESRRYARRLQDLLRRMRIGPIKGWTSLEQNYGRKIAPVLEEISSIGDAVTAMRIRISDASQRYQTNILVEQAKENLRSQAILQRIELNFDTKASAVLTHVSLMLAVVSLFFTKENSPALLHQAIFLELVGYVVVAMVCLWLVSPFGQKNKFRDGILSMVVVSAITLTIIFLLTIVDKIFM